MQLLINCLYKFERDLLIVILDMTMFNFFNNITLSFKVVPIVNANYFQDLLLIKTINFEKIHEFI